MGNWQDVPPTEQEWLDANNEGYWWLKINVGPVIREDGMWPSFNLYEIVRITKEVLDGKGNRTNRLCFRHWAFREQTIYCDELPDYAKAYQWKPVEPHGDTPD